MRTMLIGAGLAVLLAISHTLMRYVAGRGTATGAVGMLREHWITIACALAIYGVVFAIYLLALRTERMSLLYPLYTGLSVLLVVLSAVIVFDEPMRPLQAVGAILVAVGVAALAVR